MRRASEIGWLLLGAVLLYLSHLRWPAHALAWVAPIPWLVVLRARYGGERGPSAESARGAGDRIRAPGAVRFHLLFAGLSIAVWTAATYKIVTPPIPGVMALAFGAPFGVIRLAPFLIWERWIARGKEGIAVLAFGAASAVVDWAQAALTPLGVWGAAINTQVDNLPFLQMVSVTGLSGPAFLMAATAAALESGWARRASAQAFRAALACGVAALAIHAWGAHRLASPIEGPMVRVAAVGTDATFHGLPLPAPEEIARVDEALFARTAEAARSGARLVVWTEGATLATPDREPALRARLSQAAREARIDLVAAFIVPVAVAPLRYENKYLWVSPSGEIVQEYLKHEPVPGEPAVRGTSAFTAVDTGFGKAAGAICYDYDFPYVGLAHARLGVDLVALPSSDWAGIDPLHTQMAGIRAIEGGYSILRSTRFGLSAGIDSRGRLRAWQSASESSGSILTVDLPAKRIPTLYAALGDLTVAPFVSIFVLALAGLVRPRLLARGDAPPGANRVRQVAHLAGLATTPPWPTARKPPPVRG